MSDTPRTKAASCPCVGIGYEDVECCSAKVAREIERELSAAESKVDALMREKEELREDAERYRWLRAGPDPGYTPELVDIGIDARIEEERALVREQQNTTQEDLNSTSI